MDKIKIQGGVALNGKVCVSGSKNAALPILFASLLTAGKVKLLSVPRLQDIFTTLKLLAEMGVHVHENLAQNTVELQAKDLRSFEAPYDHVRKMRASVVVLGPLLARYGQAKVSLPGGCAIGARPIGFHISGLEKLGAQITLEGGYVLAKASKLIGARIAFDFPSVGATENVMMAAVLAKGQTVLENCACEPEIVDLATMLNSMGAKIEGAGSPTIHIQGVTELRDTCYQIMGDRIEAGTFLCAAYATGGSVTVSGLDYTHYESLLVKLEEAGAYLVRGSNEVSLQSRGYPRAVDIKTLPFPGFPTDMQAQFMALMTQAEGSSMIEETIFENRFMHVPELCRLGADINVKGNGALVRGRRKLVGAPLMATDLRASASLVMGGLCAQGETVINRIYHLDRGYENLESKLRSLGAQIERTQ